MRVGESFAPQHESSWPQELIELARPVSHWFIQPIDFHQISTNVISMICGILFGIRQWYGMASERVLDLNSWPMLMQRGAMHLNRAVATQPKIAPVVPTFLRSLPLFSPFCFPGLYPETINPTILGLLQGMHLNGIAAPILRFEITLAFSNCQGLLSIIGHSWVMQLMQVDKASNFVILLAASRSTTFSRPGSWKSSTKTFALISCASSKIGTQSDDSARCAKGCIAS